MLRGTVIKATGAMSARWCLQVTKYVMKAAGLESTVEQRILTMQVGPLTDAKADMVKASSAFLTD